MANASALKKDKQILSFNKKFEIVSLIGTLSDKKCHLHISLSDGDGKVIGGHLKKGCTIYTTVEIVIGELPELEFACELDKSTSLVKLVVTKLK